MTLHNLRISLKRLHKGMHAAPVLFKERIMQAYIKKILSDYAGTVMSDAIDEEVRVAALAGLLHATWALVSGTCLSYTAIPSAAVTYSSTRK